MRIYKTNSSNNIEHNLKNKFFVEGILNRINLILEKDNSLTIKKKLSDTILVETNLINKENKLDSLLSESYEIKNKVKSKLNNIEIENLNLKNKLIERLEM